MVWWTGLVAALSVLEFATGEMGSARTQPDTNSFRSNSSGRGEGSMLGYFNLVKDRLI